MGYPQHRIMSHFLTRIQELLQSFLKDRDTATSFFLHQKDVSVDECFCLLHLLGMDRVTDTNMMNRLQVVRSIDGVESECLVKPALLLRMRCALVMGAATMAARLTLMGELLGFLRENDHLPVGEFDWAGNEGEAVRLDFQPLPTSFNAILPKNLLTYASSSLLLEWVIGLESSQVEKITRVKERKYTALHK